MALFIDNIVYNTLCTQNSLNNILPEESIVCINIPLCYCKINICIQGHGCERDDVKTF